MIEMIRTIKWTAPLVSLMLMMALTACGMAGGRRASAWKGRWYREGDAPFSRCWVDIENVNSKGFDFSLTVYNGVKAGELKHCHADFEKVSAVYYEEDSSTTGLGEDEGNDNQEFFRENLADDEGYAAFYYAEDPRSYIEFRFDGDENDILNISFCTTGGFVEWTAFEGFRENAQITGSFSRQESYINDNLYDAGVLDKRTDDALRRLMGDTAYFRAVCCFQNYTVERSDTTGSNTPYEYGGAVHMHDGIGGTIYYASMEGRQYAACVIAYDDGSVSAAISQEDGSLSYYSNNWVYEKEQPYPILIWIERYTDEQNSAQTQES